MVFTTDVKEETQLGPTVVYSALGFVIDVNHIVNVIDVNVLEVIEQLYKCTFLYIILNRLNAYNMLMKLLTYNTSGKAAFTIANCNQHYEVS